MRRTDPGSLGRGCSTRSRASGSASSAPTARSGTMPSHGSTRCSSGPRASRSRAGSTTLPHLRGNELDDIAFEAADDALMSVLASARRLPRREPVHDLGLQVRPARGGGEASQAGVAGTGDPTRAGDLGPLRERGPPRAEAERATELLRAVQQAIATSSHRTSGASSLALAVDGVPIDVLADHLDTTRGALYKTLHDARRKLRRHLEECGHAARGWRSTDGTTRHDAAARPAARPGGPRGRLRRRASRSSTATSSSSSRAPTPDAAIPGLRGAPRRLPRLPRGAREPARARRGRVAGAGYAGT